ncbi:hypothetical protein NJT12_05655 [Flavobacterium sp. AC]|uniref:Uncharacterized protein n=1 Tax=Flavobacterium azizsancarii TaxID=2961580 RepID=A0ABT4WAH9_9FLAO|nr:hypothetical protein [Flavobacterium azizsancarii]MDA6069099.1 hypothetical protein [Flavobacterium azizsancarii]
MKYIFLGFFLFSSLSLGITLFFLTSDFKEFVHLILYLIPVILIISLLISFGANRVGFFQALPKQKALVALGLLGDQNLMQTIYNDVPKFGKVRERIGAIYSY